MYHGSESISFLGPKMWKTFPDEIKQETSLINLNKSLKNEPNRLSI